MCKQIKSMFKFFKLLRKRKWVHLEYQSNYFRKQCIYIYISNKLTFPVLSADLKQNLKKHHFNNYINQNTKSNFTTKSLGHNKKIVCLPKRDRPDQNPPSQILLLTFFPQIIFSGFLLLPYRHHVKF